MNSAPKSPARLTRPRGCHPPSGVFTVCSGHSGCPVGSGPPASPSPSPQRITAAGGQTPPGTVQPLHVRSQLLETTWPSLGWLCSLLFIGLRLSRCQPGWQGTPGAGVGAQAGWPSRGGPWVSSRPGGGRARPRRRQRRLQAGSLSTGWRGPGGAVRTDALPPPGLGVPGVDPVCRVGGPRRICGNAGQPAPTQGPRVLPPTCTQLSYRRTAGMHEQPYLSEKPLSAPAWRSRLGGRAGSEGLRLGKEAAGGGGGSHGSAGRGPRGPVSRSIWAPGGRRAGRKLQGALGTQPLPLTPAGRCWGACGRRRGRGHRHSASGPRGGWGVRGAGLWCLLGSRPERPRKLREAHGPGG